MTNFIPKNNAVQQMYADKFGFAFPAGTESLQGIQVVQGTQELEPIEGIQGIQGVQDTEETEPAI